MAGLATLEIIFAKIDITEERVNGGSLVVELRVGVRDEAEEGEYV